MATHHHDHHHGPSEQGALRAEALESLLIEKGLVTPEAIDAIIRAYEEEIGPMNGAKVIARAWIDADYRRRLLENPKAAVEELGLDGLPEGMLNVVANRPGIHNVIVCTLCSCYPSRLLGISPTWYKEPAYRSRVVREPRQVLREMGLELEQDVEIQVWDSSAEMRYMVLPERPPGTEGWSEEALAPLVTRDAMIGVARAKLPGSAPGTHGHE
jgi:nitrile hydratase